MSIYWKGSGNVLARARLEASPSTSADRAVVIATHRCAHHPESTAPRPTLACYAVRTERRPDRSQLADKLQRHEGLPPALVIGAALVELQQLVDRGKTPPWVRLSTNGSLPQPAKATKLFLDQLTAFLIFAKAKRRAGSYSGRVAP